MAVKKRGKLILTLIEIGDAGFAFSNTKMCFFLRRMCNFAVSLGIVIPALVETHIPSYTHDRESPIVLGQGRIQLLMT